MAQKKKHREGQIQLPNSFQMKQSITHAYMFHDIALSTVPFT